MPSHTAAAAVTADSVRWHDAAHVQARDGPADVVAVVRVRSPAVSSTVRGSDCQVDGRVVSLSIRRSPANPLSERSPVPSRADIRVLLSGDVCSALTDTAVYRFPGTLSTASYGRQLLWLTCDDMRVPDVVSAPSGTARIVKAADKLSAHIKCIEEQKAGNQEFDAAARQTEQALRELELPCLDYFLVHCLPSFQKNLDELS